MSTDICYIYQQLCLKHKITADECILSCLNNASKNGELHLRCTTITDTNCLLISKTLKHMPTLNHLNLSDCMLSFNGLNIFLDVMNQLENVSHLNLKGNQIGNNSTINISKMLSNNLSITDLQLNWNNLGDSVKEFAQLCKCLMYNKVLNTLNLASNNLSETCCFHLAKMLNINKYLKNIDLSWNNIGDAGAMILLKSLKKNSFLYELNIQGNSVTGETCAMIAEQLKQNKANKTDIQNRSLLKHVNSIDKNYQTQINSLKQEYQNRIDELLSKLHIFQIKNEQHKLEIKELKINCLKEKDSKTTIINQVEEIKSELLLTKQSLNKVVKNISNEISHSDEETLNSLEDFEKIIFIIKRIKKKCTDNMLKETKSHRQLLDNLSKLKDELNEIKAELNNTKTSTEIEIQNYFEMLSKVKKLLLSNGFHFKISQQINNDLKNLIEQEEINTADQTKLFVSLHTQLKSLYKEKTNLETKLAESETKNTIDTQTVQILENSLMLAKEELKKFNEKQLSNIATQNLNAQLNNNNLAKEVETLKMNLIEKDRQLQLCEVEKNKININYSTELSTLQKQLQCEKQKFKETKIEDRKEIEELYLKFTQYVNKLNNYNVEDAKCHK